MDGGVDGGVDGGLGWAGVDGGVGWMVGWGGWWGGVDGGVGCRSECRNSKGSIMVVEHRLSFDVVDSNDQSITLKGFDPLGSRPIGLPVAHFTLIP